MLVSKKDVPTLSNVVRSHVIYKGKPHWFFKARVAPWGHRDLKKYSTSGDAPCLNLDGMRLLLSIAAEMTWIVNRMDVKSAFLQAKGLEREFYIRLLGEEKDMTVLWQLLVRAYGLTDSGRLGYLKSYEALMKKFGLYRSQLEPSLFLRNQNKERIILIVQVDCFLYVGTPTICKQFDAFL